MLGLGWTEMLVVGVVALIVIGPKDLPVMMNRIGKFAGMVRRMGNEFQREINRSAGLDEVRSLRNSLTAPLKQTTEEIRREFNALGANGAVKPSGVIKPADPKSESVVDEIHKAAGLPTGEPASAGTEAAPSTAPAPAITAKLPVRARRPVRLKPHADTPVVTSDLPVAAPTPEHEKAVPASGRVRSGRVKVFPAHPVEPTEVASAKPARTRRKPAADAGTASGKPS